MWPVTVILVGFSLLFQQCRSSTTTSGQELSCPFSSCGKISNISYPFRLKDDPKQCGDSRYELACENNVTKLYLYSAKYHVQSINYNNFTIRLVDPEVQQSNCSSLPRHSLSRSNFCNTYDYNNKNCNDPYHANFINQELFFDSNKLLFEHIVYMNCTHQVINNHKYVNASSCLNSNSKSKGYYIYAIAGKLVAQDFQVGCHAKLVAPTSWLGNLQRNQVLSYDIIHKALVYGFEISWMKLPCQKLCGDSLRCFFNSSEQHLQCNDLCRTVMGSWITGSCGKVNIIDVFIFFMGINKHHYLLQLIIFILITDFLLLNYWIKFIFSLYKNTNFSFYSL